MASRARVVAHHVVVEGRLDAIALELLPSSAIASSARVVAHHVVVECRAE